MKRPVLLALLPFVALGCRTTGASHVASAPVTASAVDPDSFIPVFHCDAERFDATYPIVTAALNVEVEANGQPERLIWRDAQGKMLGNAWLPYDVFAGAVVEEIAVDLKQLSPGSSSNLDVGKLRLNLLDGTGTVTLAQPGDGREELALANCRYAPAPSVSVPTGTPGITETVVGPDGRASGPTLPPAMIYACSEDGLQKSGAGALVYGSQAGAGSYSVHLVTWRPDGAIHDAVGSYDATAPSFPVDGIATMAGLGLSYAGFGPAGFAMTVANQGDGDGLHAATLRKGGHTTALLCRYPAN